MVTILVINSCSRKECSFSNC
uniref:Uncharacterized protein n=1 Tax=Tetranychus urticae TaxID=32264 RepID=T1JWG6_TETUR